MADQTNTYVVKPVEAILLASALFGTAFTIAKFMFEKNRPHMQNPSTCAPVVYRNPYTPDTERWTTTELRVVRMPNGYRIRAMKREQGKKPGMIEVENVPDLNNALYKAGEFARFLAESDPQNPLPIKVFDDMGRCAYVVYGSVNDTPGWIEGKC